jgi:hypothetical protein
MARRSDDHRTTSPISIHIGGNSLFERAAFAIGLDSQPTRQLLARALQIIGSSPGGVTPDEMGSVLPFIEERLRLMVPPAIAERSIHRLRNVLLAWDG